MIYSRESKTDDKPCVHLEWRILWSDNYKRFIELGITKKNGSYLESLKNLTEFDIAEKWEKFTEKLIKHAEINKELVGKQFSDCQGTTQLFEKMTNTWRRKNQLTEREKWHVHLMYLHCANDLKIEITAEFVRFWHENREPGKKGNEKDKALHYSRFLKPVVFM